MYPCAMGPPNGLSFFARSTSTWIHWWSPVASAKRLTCCWVTSNQSLVPSSCPFKPAASAKVVVVLLPPPILPAGVWRPPGGGRTCRRRDRRSAGITGSRADRDRRLDRLLARPPPLGPGRRRRAAAAPGRRARHGA